MLEICIVRYTSHSLLPIARAARSRFCTLWGWEIAPRFTRRSRARSNEAAGGAVGKGKFSTSDMPKERIWWRQEDNRVRIKKGEIEGEKSEIGCQGRSKGIKGRGEGRKGELSRAELSWVELRTGSGLRLWKKEKGRVRDWWKVGRRGEMSHGTCSCPICRHHHSTQYLWDWNSHYFKLRL